MSQVAIQARNVSKRYQYGAKASYARLTDALVGLVTGPFRRLSSARPSIEPEAEQFWALQDISFDVNPGEVVGIIGRNGAGKSTLLKILSRITEPTTGRIEVRGRIGSLLEVGTGFHPELTGRENIYLNGIILGMKRAEIARKFDEIVAFAETEKFLDTPVKHYSSGMYMRLAFAVAAHLESEILIVDEVLAVGDAGFQKKCLGRMNQVARDGRTVLFVSHNMAAVLNLCNRGILLRGGRVIANDKIDTVVQAYQQSHEADSKQTVFTSFPMRQGTGVIRFASAELKGNPETNVIEAGGLFSVVLTLSANQPTSSETVLLSVGINDHMGTRLASCLSTWSPELSRKRTMLVTGTTVTCELPSLCFAPGVYTLSLYLDINGQISDVCREAIPFEVHAADFFGTGRLPSSSQGPVLLPQNWSLQLPVGGES